MKLSEMSFIPSITIVEKTNKNSVKDVERGELLQTTIENSIEVFQIIKSRISVKVSNSK